MIMPTRRALLSTFPLLAAPALAQTRYNSRPIRLVLPFPAGGATDGVARMLAPSLAARLNQNVVIDNRPGAGGATAAELVARAAPDGLTLLLTSSSTHVTLPAVTPRLPYDPDRDFTPIAMLTSTPNLVLVSATVPVTDLAGFIAWCRAHPGDVNYGSSGIGAQPHLAGALFNALTGAGMVHVPYRGTGPVYAELRRGEVQALFDVPLTAAPHLQSGAVRALAVTAETRSAQVPDVPTVAEAGLPAFVVITYFALYGPAHLPAAMQRDFLAAAEASLAEPELKRRLLDVGNEVTFAGPEQLARTAQIERARWTKVVQDAGIRAND